MEPWSTFRNFPLTTPPPPLPPPPLPPPHTDPWSHCRPLPVAPPHAAVPPPQTFPRPPPPPVTPQTFHNPPPVPRPPVLPVSQLPPWHSGEGTISRFIEGDDVVVAEGELRNLKGKVERVEGDIVHISSPELAPPMQTLACRENVLCKYFAPGLEVTVICGSAKGATGTVANVDGRVVSLSLDENKELLLVCADDVIDSSEAIHRPEKYEIHDLVILDDRSFGVIVHSDGETFHVLKGVPDDTPEVGFARRGEIVGKIEKRGSALDHLHDEINVRDVVKVIEGPLKRKQGVIQHIFRGVVFMRDCRPREHAGIICAKAQSCVLIGRLRRERELDGNQFPPGFLHFRNAPASKEPDTFGADVEVVSGPSKGFKGRVIGKKGTSVRVLLDDDQREVIIVERDDIVRQQ